MLPYHFYFNASCSLAECRNFRDECVGSHVEILTVSNWLDICCNGRESHATLADCLSYRETCYIISGHIFGDTKTLFNCSLQDAFSEIRLPRESGKTTKITSQRVSNSCRKFQKQSSLKRNMSLQVYFTFKIAYLWIVKGPPVPWYFALTLPISVLSCISL